MVIRAMPVPVCVAMTSAPGSTAPLESCTDPLICAVACAQTVPQVNVASHKPVHNVVNKRFILPPSPLPNMDNGGSESRVVVFIKVATEAIRSNLRCQDTLVPGSLVPIHRFETQLYSHAKIGRTYPVGR